MMPVKKRKLGRRLIRVVPFFAFTLPLLVAGTLAWAEPPNPFDGGGEPPPPPPPPADFGFNEADAGGGEPGFGFGGDTPPPAFNDTPPDSPSAAPQRPSGAVGSTGKTTSPPPSVFNENAKRNSKGRQPKLADYLELDPAIRSLEVKNFDLPDKDIKDVVTLISKWTGKNFILDNKVRGKITIIGPSQVTLQEAYHAFLSALDANNLTTVQSGKFIRIIEAAEARRQPVQTYAGEFAPDTDQYITRIFQLKHINSDEVQREFRDMTSRQGKLFAYEPTNSIIITDTGSNIRRIEGILKTLDIKNFETTLHVLKIKNGNSKGIADMLAEIYGDGKSGGARGGATSGPRVFRRNALDRLRGGGVISKVIPDEGTNSLIVLANQAGFRQLVELVDKLDVRVSDSGKIHVYYCEYAKAEDLASTLASLAGGGGGAKAKGGRTTTVTGGAGAAPATGGGGPVTAELEGGVKITSDAATNALVVTANVQDYQTLRRVIKKLDIPRLQVFVESAILELTIDHSSKYGANIGIPLANFGLAGGFITDPAALTGILTKTGLPEGVTLPLFFGNTVSTPIGIPGANGAASTATTNVPLSSFTGLLNLLAKDTNTSVLSTPQILAMDNEKAEFKVQDETPVQSTFNVVPGAGGPAGNFAQGNVERLKTGIEIKLTPHINAASRTIRLELEQKIDSIRSSNDVPLALAAVQKATTSRVTNTTVVVRDGDYIMLGGLMSDQVDEKVTKVPLLGDIPILGWLFKAKTSATVKKNLIILLKPRILGTTYDAAKLTEEHLDKRQDFVDRHFGGTDEHEDHVTELRERLLEQRRRGAQQKAFDYRNNEEEVTPEASLNRSAESYLDEPKEKPKTATRKTASSPSSLSSQSGQPGPSGADSGSIFDGPANNTPADKTQALPEPAGLD